MRQSNIAARALYEETRHLPLICPHGHVDPDSPLAGVANAGLYALVVYLAVLLVGSLVLLYRYRWLER